MGVNLAKVIPRQLYMKLANLRVSQLTPEEIAVLREIDEEYRSRRALAQDLRRSARVPRYVRSWLKHPGRYDIPGVDTPPQGGRPAEGVRPPRKARVVRIVRRARKRRRRPKRVREEVAEAPAPTAANPIAAPGATTTLSIGNTAVSTSPFLTEFGAAILKTVKRTRRRRRKK